MTNPSPDKYCTRPVKESELEELLRLVDLGGWVLTWDKLRIFFHERLGEFMVAQDVETNQLVGAASLTPGRPNEATAGNIIVHPSLRNQGLGMYFLTEIVKQVMKPNLALTGFSQSDTFYVRFGGNPDGQEGTYSELDVDREALDAYVKDNQPTDVVTTSFTDDWFEELHKYDLEVRGYDNRPYLSLLTRTCDHTVLAMTKAERRIVGYIATWKDKNDVLNNNGLYADDDKIAALLLRESLSKFPNVNRLKCFTMSNKFILKFGEEKSSHCLKRFAWGGTIVPIPQERLYCLTECDLSY